MNNILIPIDFSENSNAALEYASFIAKTKGVKLIILHITKDAASVELQLERITALSFMQEIDAQIVVREGKNISKIIKKVGVEFGVDLIVIGSNGISSVGELILGSDTENVIRSSQFNVLTIKHKMLSLGLDSVLFPSDFSSEAYSVFETVKAFADLFGAKIYLLSVVTSNRKKELENTAEKMDAFVRHFSLTNSQYEKEIYQANNRELGVLNYSIDKDVDMIAIGSHGKGIVRKLVKESISQGLVKNTFKPILTVRF